MSSIFRVHGAAVAACIFGLSFLMVVVGCGRKAPQGKAAPSPVRSPQKIPASDAPRAQSSTEIPTSVDPCTLANKEFKIDLAPNVPMEFVGISSGSFMMGNNQLGVRRQQQRIAKPFYLSKCEVTQEQWQAVMGNNPSLHKGPPKRPVERINWDDCQAFLQKLNEKFADTGMQFGLPTEAQWEWACRAGTTLRVDSTDNPDKINEFGWIGTNSALETHPVAEKKPNNTAASGRIGG